MQAIWVGTCGLLSTLSQYEHRYRAVPGNLLGHTSKEPAFETSISVAAHDHQVCLLLFYAIQERWCYNARLYLRGDFYSCQITRVGNSFEVDRCRLTICFHSFSGDH